MPQHPVAAERLSRLHRTWWILACSILGGLWLAALLVHCLYSVNQHQAALEDGTRKLFGALMELHRDLPDASGNPGRQDRQDRQDRQNLIGTWLPSHLQEAGFGRGARVVGLSERDARSWLARHRFPDDRRQSPLSLPSAINVSLNRLEFEVLFPFPKEPPPRPNGFPPPQPDRLPGFDPPPPGDAPPPREMYPGPPDLEFIALIREPLLPILAPLFGLYGVLLLVVTVLLGSFRYALQVAQKGIAQELAIAHAKANFTAMVSHELKTPVAVLRMYSEMLRDGLVIDPLKQREFYGTMASESLRLQCLIENLLDLGKVQSGSKTYRLLPERLEGILQDAISLASSTLSDRPGEVSCDHLSELPLVEVDREVAVQAISNVIHNALKYGGGSRVEVQARLHDRFVALDVLDRGAGIPIEEQERIFDPYVRIGSEDTRTAQGTGLGLALVRAYMEGHGGSAMVKERPGGGSVFTLNFRIAAKGE